jgi:hypothetical protein
VDVESVSANPAATVPGLSRHLALKDSVVFAPAELFDANTFRQN